MKKVLRMNDLGGLVEVIDDQGRSMLFDPSEIKSITATMNRMAVSMLKKQKACLKCKGKGGRVAGERCGDCGLYRYLKVRS